jgi:hypothetical protein
MPFLSERDGTAGASRLAPVGELQPLDPPSPAPYNRELAIHELAIHELAIHRSPKPVPARSQLPLASDPQNAIA